MRMSSSAVALAVAIAFAAPASAASYTYATAVDWVNNGTVGASNNRNNPLNALGAPDGKFLSLGLTIGNASSPYGSNPGFAVFDFGTMFSGSGIVVETTFNCGGGAVCASHKEQIEVRFGTDYNFGSHDFADLGDFMIGEELITNGSAQGDGKIFTIASGPFRYLALIDRSRELGRSSIDGFDVDSVGVVGVSAVPLPAALPLLAAGLGVMALFGRRRTA